MTSQETRTADHSITDAKATPDYAGMRAAIDRIRAAQDFPSDALRGLSVLLGQAEMGQLVPTEAEIATVLSWIDNDRRSIVPSSINETRTVDRSITDAEEACIASIPTVRIRSRVFPGNIYAYWCVRPSQADTMMPRIWNELDAIRAEEPGMDWQVETRGTDADWHWYQ